MTVELICERKGISLKKILIQLIPYDDESFYSFIARTAEANCMTLRRLITIIGYLAKAEEYNIYNVSKEKLLIISKLIGTPVNLLKSMLSFNNGDRPEVNMIHLGIQTLKLKICPQCFTENEYLKKEWSLTLVTVCPLHHCKLVDQCPACGKYIPIFRQSFLGCNCGLKFRELPVINVPLNECVLSKVIYSKINPRFEYVFENWPIEKLSITDLIKLFLFMGRFFEMNKKTYHIPNILSSTTSNQLIHELMHQVVNMFLNWPSNFNSFLDNYDRFEKRTRSGHKITQFATLRYGLNTFLKEKSFTFLEDALNTYAFEMLKRRLHIKGKRIKNDSDLLTIPEASELLGENVEGIHQLINIGKLKALVQKVGNNEHIAIKRTDMEDYLDNKINSISMVELQDILKTNPIFILQLLNEGMIQGEVSKERGASFNKSSVYKLLSLLDRKAEFIDSIIGYLPLKESAFMVLQLYGDRKSKKHYSYIDVLKYLITEKSKLYRNGEAGFNRYFLKKEELKQFFDHFHSID
ncbi:TniQ family protein [Paenibacillus sp. 7523-1]|uniref:TniQ family protein n=1 Tax=Paenibacillus sp. 7523-1 TaxID=2022550 RepID=UPI000BA548A7|nr:TniQ family protein [Paenibacillus sp. 7523-1]PAD28717.1 hypothetical protein CHH60_23745 [Paenibacillus sp. 7523-1]